MAALPTGTVTFLITDIEGSTRLVQQLGDRYADVPATHHRLLRTAIQEAQGQVRDTQGDSVFAVFPGPGCPARRVSGSAGRAGTSLARWDCAKGAVGLHRGEPISGAAGYVGIHVHRTARIAAAGHGGQILVSEATHGLIAKDLPGG